MQTLLADLTKSSTVLLKKGSFLNIGLGAYRVGQDAGFLLAHVDATLAAAEARVEMRFKQPKPATTPPAIGKNGAGCCP